MLMPMPLPLHFLQHIITQQICMKERGKREIKIEEEEHQAIPTLLELFH